MENKLKSGSCEVMENEGIAKSLARQLDFIGRQ